jgi:hypothetical protein
MSNLKIGSSPPQASILFPRKRNNQQKKNKIMAVIQPSRYFEGSKLHSWNPQEGIYRAVFKKYYDSPTSQGYDGFKMKWELISDPAFLHEVTNSYSYRRIGLFSKLMESWTRGKKRMIRRDEKTNLPDLSAWLGQEADVVVKKFGTVPYIDVALPPETLLVQEDQYSYRIKDEYLSFDDL